MRAAIAQQQANGDGIDRARFQEHQGVLRPLDMGRSMELGAKISVSTIFALVRRRGDASLRLASNAVVHFFGALRCGRFAF